MKIKSIKRYAAAVVFIAAFPLAVVSAENPDFEASRNMEVLFNLYREVNKLYVDTPNQKSMLKNSAEGMLNGLDPYTEFLADSDLESFEMLTTGKYGGIGSLIRKRDEWVEIAEPYRGFPADKAGLKAGDKVIAVDGKSMKNATTSQVSSLMKGDPETSFKLTVEKFTTGEREDITIKRERIAISGISYYGMVNDSTGYISHENFSDGCSNDFRHALMELRKQGAKALIIDLRSNGGGIMDEAEKIAGMFLPSNTKVVSLKGRNGGTGKVYNTSATPIDTDMRIAVLVSRMSASAAEIVAGVFQDMDRAVLIGQRSFGKGLVQTTRPLGFDSYAKITTAKYYIPSGRCIQAIDYSHLNPDGSAGEVPDSLIREFTTRNGRKVYDGGGIMPDIVTEQRHYSAFTANIFASGYIEEYSMKYLQKSGFKPVDKREFKLTDEDYADFVEFMRPKEIKFESATASALQHLEETAGKEKYGDRISADIEAIRTKISKTKEEEMTEFRKEIAELIENNIVLYYHYSQGVVERNMHNDTDVAEAIKILSGKDAYQSILTSKDTAKK